MEQLDQDAVNLTKAIRTNESNNNFSAVGKSGEYGAYQFTEPTWNSTSVKYGVNVPLRDATPTQQNEVAYKQIKEWKDKGWNVGEIASAWNAGPGKRNAYLTGHKGVNEYGAEYDTKEYARKVAETYQSLKGSTAQSNQGYHTQPVFYNKPDSINTVTEQPKDETLGGQLKQRASTASEALSKAAKGEINPLSGLLQTAGAGFGAITDVGEAAINKATGGLLKKGEEFIGEKVVKPALETNIGKKAVSYAQEYSQKHPEASANIGAVTDIATAIPVLKGVGIAKNLAVKGTETAFKGQIEKSIVKEIKSALPKTVSAKRALSEVGDDVKLLANKELRLSVDEAGKYTEDSVKNSYESLGQKISDINNNELQPILDEVSQKQSIGESLSTLKKKAIQEAKNDADLKESGMVPKAIKQIEDRFNGWKYSYGDVVDLATQNRLKIGSGKFTDWNTPEGTADKAIYRALQQNIENVAKKNGFGDAVSNANAQMAKLIKTQNLLKHLTNKKPKMGVIRKTLTNAKGTAKGLIKKGVKTAVGAGLTGLGFAGGSKLLGN